MLDDLRRLATATGDDRANGGVERARHRANLLGDHHLLQVLGKPLCVEPRPARARLDAHETILHDCIAVELDAQLAEEVGVLLDDDPEQGLALHRGALLGDLRDEVIGIDLVERPIGRLLHPSHVESTFRVQIEVGHQHARLHVHLVLAGLRNAAIEPIDVGYERRRRREPTDQHLSRLMELQEQRRALVRFVGDRLVEAGEIGRDHALLRRGPGGFARRAGLHHVTDAAQRRLLWYVEAQHDRAGAGALAWIQAGGDHLAAIDQRDAHHQPRRRSTGFARLTKRQLGHLQDAIVGLRQL